jgi:ABC-type uncharacterized transport system auxiliary subunit
MSGRRDVVAFVAAFALALAGCGSSLPATRFYQLAAPAPGATGGGGAVLVLEPLSTDGGYDDERMVYRISPYRLDYYQYHRWSAPPGVLVGGFLEAALGAGGLAVVRAGDVDAPLVLGGRVIAIEEVDQAPTRWAGRIAVAFALRDRTGAVVWSGRYDEVEPMTAQDPEGLARALTAALGRIVAKVGPAVVEAVAKRPTVAGP